VAYSFLAWRRGSLRQMSGGNMMMLWLHKEKVGSYVTVAHLVTAQAACCAFSVGFHSEWMGQIMRRFIGLLAL